MAEAVLDLDRIEVRYRHTAVLKIPSLSIQRGEVVAIIGPNGAGKSTLIRVMGLLDRPDTGSVHFHGREVGRRDALLLRRRIATVFQEPLLLNATVYDNAAIGLKLRRLDRKTIARRVGPWLDRLGISHLIDRQARSLSGGEAQRTSLVRALALEPELLLLDEPFSALDPPTREGLLLDLQTILRDTGISTVFVTHDRSEAFMLADRVGVLIRGELPQIAPAAEIFAHPATREVAGFVGMENQLCGVVESASAGSVRVRLDCGIAKADAQVAAGDHVVLCLRPEDIALSAPGAGDCRPGEQNRFLGKVARLTPLGPYYRVALNCSGTPFIAFVGRAAFLEPTLAEGADVTVLFTPSAAHVIGSRQGSPATRLAPFLPAFDPATDS